MVCIPKVEIPPDFQLSNVRHTGAPTARTDDNSRKFICLDFPLQTAVVLRETNPPRAAVESSRIGPGLAGDPEMDVLGNFGHDLLHQVPDHKL